MISAMLMAMSMTCNSVSAQSQGRGHAKNRVERREPRKETNRNAIHNRPGNNSRPDRVAHAPKQRDRHDPRVVPVKARLVRCEPPRISRGCYVPGWEGRVRYHHNGRWGYCVNGVWRYYDCYYDPYEFFCEPVPVHHAHTVYTSHASAGEVAAGVVAGTILGCIIGSLAN